MADSRARLAGVVGAEPCDVVFFPNPTTAMNMVARSLKLQPGDEIDIAKHKYVLQYQLGAGVQVETAFAEDPAETFGQSLLEKAGLSKPKPRK